MKRIIGTLILMVLMVSFWANSAFAESSPTTSADFPSLINGLGLSQDQYDKTMKLTREFLLQLQISNQDLTKLMAPPASGSATDPQAVEKIGIVKQQFRIKLEEYHLDLADVIGEDKAGKIIEQIHGIIPQVLIPTGQIAASNHNAHGMPMGNNSNMPGMANNSAMNMPNNSNNTGASSGNNSGNSMPNMNNMPGMSNKPNINITENMSPNVNVTPNINAPNMNNMPGMSNMPGMANMNGTGANALNRQILNQLQLSNSMLTQWLVTISSQPDSKNIQTQIQLIYQMLNNQSMIIQMLSASLNDNSGGTNSANMGGMGNMGGTGSGNMNGMGKGNMGGMGMMGK